MCSTLPLSGQVDPVRAEAYFKEAKAFCDRDGGRLWGVSLCGPMVIADAATSTIATNQPAPEGARPRNLGFANATTQWGGVEWSTFVWQLLASSDKSFRGILMMHELFHRVERPLGLMTDDGQNSHLDTLEGRYWQLLEWRALARALGSSGTEQTADVKDALAFRFARRQLFPAAAANEVLEEIREGLAHYTATVITASSPQDAASKAILQLADFAQRESLVRDFGYASGSAYGILLDAWSPGWTRQLKGPEDLGERLRIAGGIAVAGLDSRETAERAALRYDSTSLRNAEEKRDAAQKAKVAELRKRFVDSPVLVLPNAGGSFSSSASHPSQAQELCQKVHVTAAWGVLKRPSPPAGRPEQQSACPGHCAGFDARRRWVDPKNSSGLGGACGNRPGDFSWFRTFPGGNQFTRVGRPPKSASWKLVPEAAQPNSIHMSA
jgi:hypothetical protein